ncbi:hypothetical protein FBR05_12665 [Deltaproteobacteria bacterium PRO3]|nr:hypothetical protein [Deltaproteobacteria bacterium PRO3]
MIPIIFAGAAVAAFFLTGCNNHDDSPPPKSNTDPNKVLNGLRSRNESSFKIVSDTLTNAPTGTRLAVSHVCPLELPHYPGINNYYTAEVCRIQIAEFQKIVIETFSPDNIVECSVAYAGGMGTTQNILQSVICTINKTEFKAEVSDPR